MLKSANKDEIAGEGKACKEGQKSQGKPLVLTGNFFSFSKQKME